MEADETAESKTGYVPHDESSESSETQSLSSANQEADSDSNVKFFEYVVRGDSKKVMRMLNSKRRYSEVTTLVIQSETGNTCLHLAAANGHYELCAALSELDEFLADEAEDLALEAELLADSWAA